MAQAAIVTLNGKDYKLDDFSEAARMQLANVQVADAEIVRLQQQLAITQTARNAYFASLIAEVESVAPAKPAPAKPAPAKKATKAKATKN